MLDHTEWFGSKKLLYIQTAVSRHFAIKRQLAVVASLPDSKTFNVSPSGYSPVLHYNGTSLLHIFIGPSRHWPAWTSIILQRFPAFLEMCEHWTICAWLSQSSSHIFQVLVHFHASFSRFTVKINQGMLLHVKTFDMWNNHTLPLTAIKRQLLMPQRWACGHWHKHILAVRTVYYFANLFAGHSGKNQSHYLPGTLCIYGHAYMHCNTKYCITIDMSSETITEHDKCIHNNEGHFQQAL